MQGSWGTKAPDGAASEGSIVARSLLTLSGCTFATALALPVRVDGLLSIRPHPYTTNAHHQQHQHQQHQPPPPPSGWHPPTPTTTNITHHHSDYQQPYPGLKCLGAAARQSVRRSVKAAAGYSFSFTETRVNQPPWLPSWLVRHCLWESGHE